MLPGHPGEGVYESHLPGMPPDCAGGRTLCQAATVYVASIRIWLRDPVHDWPPQPGGCGPPGSAPDAVTDVRGLRRVDHPDDLQLDVRRQHVEQPEPWAVPGAPRHPMCGFS